MLAAHLVCDCVVYACFRLFCLFFCLSAWVHKCFFSSLPFLCLVCDLTLISLCSFHFAPQHQITPLSNIIQVLHQPSSDSTSSACLWTDRVLCDVAVEHADSVPSASCRPASLQLYVGYEGATQVVAHPVLARNILAAADRCHVPTVSDW